MLRRYLHLLGIFALVLLLSGAGTAQAANTPANKVDMHAYMSVVILPKSAPDADNLVYDIVVTNHGDTYSRNVKVTLPFDTAALTLKEVVFSGGPGWSVNGLANPYVFHIDRLFKNHPTTATVTFARVQGAPKVVLTERAAYTWTLRSTTYKGQSNRPMTLQAIYSLGVDGVSTSDGPTARFTGDIFAPGEPLTFWCNMPDGAVHALKIRNNSVAVMDEKLSRSEQRAHHFTSFINANDLGGMQLDLPVKNLGAGAYSIVAHGNWSGLNAIGEFMIE